MNLAKAALLSALLMAVLPFAASADSLMNSLPNFFYDTPVYDIHDYVLDRTCLSLHSSNWGLSCNPAMMADEHKEQFRINAIADDNIGAADDMRRKVENDDSVGIADKLIGENNGVVTKAVTGVWYQHDWWAVSYAPVRMYYSSISRNPAYPEVAADIVKESEVALKGGVALAEDPNIHLGLQLRYLDRDFIRQDFALLDAVADSSILQIESQKSVVVEPAFSYVWSDTSWRPTFTAMLSDGQVWRSGSADGDMQPVMDFGFGMTPAFANGRLQTATHYTSRPDVTEVARRWNWGTLYNFDKFSVSGNVGIGQLGFGVSTAIDSVVLGVAYKYEEIAPDQLSSTSWSSTIFQAGLVF